MQAATSRIALALFLIVVIAVGGLYFLLDEGGSSEAAIAVPRAAVEDERGSDLAGADQPEAGARAALAGRAIEMAIPVGTRLEGLGSLTGRVLERETGATLPGLRVDLAAMPSSSGAVASRVVGLFAPTFGLAELTAPAATTITDVTGAFRFEGVEVGSYFVHARGPHHVSDAPVHARVMSTGDGGPIDIYARSGGRVLGIVLDAEEQPVRDARVVVMPGLTSLFSAMRTGDLELLEARTNDEGVFVVDGVPPGADWEVTATGARIAIAQVGGVVVRAGEDTQVVVRAGAGGVLTGRVVSHEPGSATPLPIAGAHVGAVPRGLRALPFAREILLRTHAVSDAAGNYRMTGVPSGEVDVLGYAPEHSPAKGPSAWVLEGQAATADDFLLERGPMVSGRVTDTAGAPLAGVTVTWQAIDENSLEFDLSYAPLVAQATRGFEFPRTDSEGRFTAGAFAKDSYRWIEFEKQGYGTRRITWDGEEQDLLVLLPGAAVIEGVVMDAKEHVPVTSFSVRVDGGHSSDREEFRAVFSRGLLQEHAQGRFRVETTALEVLSRSVDEESDAAAPAATQGQVDLVFLAPGYLTTEVSNIEIHEGETTRGIIVELVPGGAIAGRVVDEGGVGVAGAQVFWRLLEADAERPGEGRESMSSNLPGGMIPYFATLGMLGGESVISAPDGSFELLGVEPGSGMVVAMHRGYTVGGSEPVDVRLDGESVEVTVTLETGGTIHGKVVDRHSRPMPGAVVLAVSPSNMGGNDETSTRGGFFQGRANKQGRYRLEHVDAGVYFLVMARADEALTLTSLLGSLNFDLVTVGAGEDVEYDLVDLSSGGTRVHGRVLASDMQVTRGQVIAMGYESDSLLGFDLKIARIDRDGSYEFEGLSSGEYQFQLESIGGDVGDVRLIVDIPDAPEYRLDLHVPDGRIEGRVLDAVTGDPLNGVRLRVEAADALEPQGLVGQMIGDDAGVSWARTDEDGHYSVARLPAGDYELVAGTHTWGSSDHATSDPLIVSLATDEVRRGTDFHLQPARQVEVHVRGDDAQPLAGARIRARHVERPDEVNAWGWTDEAGVARIGGLIEGVYDLTVGHDDFAEGRLLAVELVPGETPPIELTLVRGVEVIVTVLGANGQPVSGGAARLVPARGEGDAAAEALLRTMLDGSGVSDADGRLNLGRYTPGEYVLEARRGAEQYREELIIDPGGTVRLTARLR